VYLIAQGMCLVVVNVVLPLAGFEKPEKFLVAVLLLQLIREVKA